MTQIFSKISLSLMILAAAGCSSSSKSTKAGKGYVTYSSGSFKLQPYKEVQLENGMKVFFIQDQTLPRVSLTLLVKVGSLQESAADAGLNSLTAYMLEQGTQTRDAMTIADEFGQIASSLSISPSYDTTTVFADSLSNSKETLLNLFADVVMSPAFKDSEINRIRSQMVASLQKKVDNPSSFANEKADAFIFGSHPYGRDTSGTPESLKTLRKQSLIKHFLTYYRPNNASLAVVGNFDSSFEEQVKMGFGKWGKRNIPALNVPAPPESDSLKVRAVVKKNLQQTQIRVGELGITRNDPDYLTLRLANEVLGGSFASRLNQKIRDDLGLTYSIYSGFDTKLQRGSFDISTFTKNDSVGKTLAETLKVVNDFVAQGATEQELAAAKSQLIGQFPRAIETPDRLAYNLLALDFYGIPVTYLTNFNSNVNKVKLKDLNAAIQKRLHPKALRVLIYGDEKILPQLKSYSPEVVKM
ncbi:Peptidase M16 inactive domain protein [compost metagenome]